MAQAQGPAQGPAGGYHQPDDGSGKTIGGDWLSAIRSALGVPLGWLRQSSRSFQSMMRQLAERSAQVAGTQGAPPPRAKGGQKGGRDEPPRESKYGGEAGAGPDRSPGGSRVKGWLKRNETGAGDAGSKASSPGAKAGTESRPGPGEPPDKSSEAAPEPAPGPAPTSCRSAGVQVSQGSWYVVKRGDTLWRIADVHLGAGEAWPRLKRANSARLSNADLIYPCQCIYIPHWRCCGAGGAGEPQDGGKKSQGSSSP